MKKENKRVYITKKLLREALMQLLQTRDIDKVSVKELCEEAYVNRSTFYRYYTLPKDILLEMETEIFAQFRITKPFQDLEEVRAYLERGLQYIYENAATMRILMHNTTVDDYTGLATEFVQQVLEVSGVDGISPQKIRMLMAYMGAGSFYAMRQWLDDNTPVPPEDLMSFTMELVDRSIRVIS